MKKILIILLFSVTVSVQGSNVDSLRIDSLCRELINLKKTFSGVQAEYASLWSVINSQKSIIDGVKESFSQQESYLNDLKQKVSSDISAIKYDVKGNYENIYSTINNRSLLGVTGIILLLGIVIALYSFFHKKITKDTFSIDKIKAAQESLEEAQKAMQEEAIKLDNKLVDLFEMQFKQNTESKQDHSFVLDIANEIARIEQNLAFMDIKVKGVSNLKNRAAAINDRLKSKGYEIPKLVGENYIDENNMKPTMELDENLPIGTQIIRRVIKPMVLYKGEMIQAAEVVVAYNE